MTPVPTRCSRVECGFKRRHRGQSLTECLLVLTGIVLFALVGIGLLGAGMGAQSASMAAALAGGTPRAQTVFDSAYEAAETALADFDEATTGAQTNGGENSQGSTANGGGSSPSPATPGSSRSPGGAAPPANESSIAFAQGFASGLIDTLYEELSALLSPFETAQALAELLRLLATDFIATIKLLFDELVVQQLDKLFNGSDYERGFVIGNQASPLKALSVLAKASGAVGLVGIVQRVEGAEGIARINDRRPINYKYAGKTHPSGIRFNAKGFPDFSPYAKSEVNLNNLTGNYKKDAALANAAAGLKKTPKGYVWHHVEDGRTLQLIPVGIHRAVRHTGGAAIIRHQKRVSGLSP